MVVLEINSIEGKGWVLEIRNIGWMVLVSYIFSLKTFFLVSLGIFFWEIKIVCVKRW